MQSLRDLTREVSESDRNDLLRYSFVFPLTGSLKEDKAFMEYDTKGDLIWDSLKEFVGSHPEAIAISMREDLLVILGIMQEVADELNLEYIDQIRIYRGGLNIFRIVTGSYFHFNNTD